MPETVKIGCRVPTGLRLRVYDWVDGPIEPVLAEIGMIELAGSGEPVATADAMSVEGDAVYTETDAGLWEKWLAWNKDSDLVTSRVVFKGNATARTPEQKAAAPSLLVQSDAKADSKPAGGDPLPAATADASKPAKAS